MVKKKAVASAKAKRWIAQNQAREDSRRQTQDEGSGDKALENTFKQRREAVGADKLSAIDNIRLKYVSLLHEVGGEEFTQVDRILGLDPGMSRRWAEKNPAAYKVWTEEHVDQCVHRFYRHKISLLEHLIEAAPATIRMWKEWQAGGAGITKDDRKLAAKEIREWTGLFLKTKQKSALRELIPQELQDAHKEAEEMDLKLQEMLGQALDLPGEEN